MFANIAGIPLDPLNIKNVEIQKWISNSNADIIGLAETNICWHKAKGGPIQERINKWTRTSLPHLQANIHTSVGYNEIEEFPKEYQIGGVAMMTRGGLSCRIMNKGNDSNKLGRWTWTDYRGVRGIKVRIITAYRLVATSNKGGTETVHAQHLRALYKLDRTEDPIKAFDIDFFAFIKECREAGHQLIVMMDANTNLRDSVFQKRMRREGLRDQLSNQPQHSKINSFFRGSTIIDGIFISRTLVMLKGGYQSFDESPGDHRGIWMEICASSLLGNTNPILKTRQPRRLQCKIAHTVRTYNNLLLQYLRKHKMAKKIKDFKRDSTIPLLTTEQQHQYELLDSQIVQGMKEADRRCRKLKMGQVQWTPEVSETNEVINSIRLILKKKKGGKVKMSLIKRTLKKAKLSKSLINKSETELHLMEAEAHMERRTYKKDHENKRDNWLEGQESKMIDQGRPVIASKLKAKRNREEMRRVSSRIKIALKPFKPRGVTKIIFKDQEVTTHEGIVEGFKTEAIKRSSQTEDTPFMTQPLVGDFGYKANNANAEKVLEGHYDPPTGTDQYARKLIPHLTKHPSVQPIETEISRQEYVSAWKNKKEYTGSGTSGLHYGHFKAMCWNKEISQIHTDMINIPMTTGYSPKRWRKADDHMEQKSPDNFNADRFRPIIHVEPDFNMANGFIGRKVMDNAEKHNILAPEQYVAVRIDQPKTKH
jgi:hypothetical protein